MTAEHSGFSEGAGEALPERARRGLNGRLGLRLSGRWICCGAGGCFGVFFLERVVESLPERDSVIFPIGVAAFAAEVLADDATGEGVLVGLIH